jgi:hypothetical protein
MSLKANPLSIAEALGARDEATFSCQSIRLLDPGPVRTSALFRLYRERGRRQFWAQLFPLAYARQVPQQSPRVQLQGTGVRVWVRSQIPFRCFFSDRGKSQGSAVLFFESILRFHL